MLLRLSCCSLHVTPNITKGISRAAGRWARLFFSPACLIVPHAQHLSSVRSFERWRMADRADGEFACQKFSVCTFSLRHVAPAMSARGMGHRAPFR